jgi:hypothetical protein
MPLEAACEPFITADDFAACECACDDLDQATIERLIEEASDILAIISMGNFVGRCERVFRPCDPMPCHCRRCPACLDGAWMIPGVLPTVLEVKVDGVILNQSEWVVANGMYLLRLGPDGFMEWPWGQPLHLPDTQPGTWSVKVATGHHINQVVRDATLELVCEFAKGCSGRKTRLPANATGANIGGVAISLQRRSEQIEESKIDLPMVSRFLAMYGGSPPSTVWSPELDRPMNITFA